MEKINYDPKYKLTGINIIENGTKISLANYLCEKLFRGIGYLFAMISILAIYATIATILIPIINHCFIYMLCAILALFALYFTISGIKNNSKPFKKCVDFMQWTYDKMVGYCMKIWALHYSINNICEPLIINNYPPNQKLIEGSILPLGRQFNPSMEKDKTKDKNKKGK